MNRRVGGGSTGGGMVPPRCRSRSSVVAERWAISFMLRIASGADRFAWDTVRVEGVRPTGTVSFLFTDVERSTQLWEAQPEAMAMAMVRHDEIVRSVIAAHRGYVFSTSGDGLAAAFWTPREALETAVEVQSSLASERWPPSVFVAVRIGVHTGTADERDGDYFGPTLNRAARIMNGGSRWSDAGVGHHRPAHRFGRAHRSWRAATEGSGHRWSGSFRSDGNNFRHCGRRAR